MYCSIRESFALYLARTVGRKTNERKNRPATSEKNHTEHALSNCGKSGKTQVHHIDENPMNNSPENLIRLCYSCRAKQHRQRSSCVVLWASLPRVTILCNKHWQAWRKSNRREVDRIHKNDKGKDGRSKGQGIAGDVEKCINSTIYSIATKQQAQGIGNNVAMTLCKDDLRTTSRHLPTRKRNRSSRHGRLQRQGVWGYFLYVKYDRQTGYLLRSNTMRASCILRRFSDISSK